MTTASKNVDLNFYDDLLENMKPLFGRLSALKEKDATKEKKRRKAG